MTSRSKKLAKSIFSFLSEAPAIAVIISKIRPKRKSTGGIVYTDISKHLQRGGIPFETAQEFYYEWSDFTDSLAAGAANWIKKEYSERMQVWFDFKSESSKYDYGFRELKLYMSIAIHDELVSDWIKYLASLVRKEKGVKAKKKMASSLHVSDVQSVVDEIISIFVDEILDSDR